MKDWESIADNLSKGGWSWGCVLAIRSNGRTIFVAGTLRVLEEQLWSADHDRNLQRRVGRVRCRAVDLDHTAARARQLHGGDAVRVRDALRTG